MSRSRGVRPSLDAMRSIQNRLRSDWERVCSCFIAQIFAFAGCPVPWMLKKQETQDRENRKNRKLYIKKRTKIGKQ